MNGPQGFFITGTDTSIGKTYISTLLARAFSKTSSVTYMKPIQTGCLRNHKGILAAPDFEFVRQGPIIQTAAYEVHVPYRFEPACSPHLAAQRSCQDISFEHIKRCYIELCGGRTIIALVEGAGGVMVPLGHDALMIDLIAYLRLPVIVVTTPLLGTLNHTLLTLQALKGRALRVAGVIMNNCRNAPNDFIYSENRNFIRQASLPAPFYEAAFESGPTGALEEFCRELI